MRLGERRLRRWLAPGVVLLGLLALGLALRDRPYHMAKAPTQAWRVCAPTAPCQAGKPADVVLTGSVTRLQTVVWIADPKAASALFVDFTGMASVQVFWNGHLIGENGRVGPDRAHERPGRFTASMPVPWDRLRAGPNLVEVRLSAHHLWAPVARPIHRLSIGPHEDPLKKMLAAYGLTLVALGLLTATLLIQATTWISRRAPDAPLHTLINAVVLLQAMVEAGKLVLVYDYPWQLARLVTVAGLASVVAILFAVLAARFIVRSWRPMLVVGAVMAVAAAWILLPPWDAKVLWMVRAGAVALLLGAAGGLRAQVPGAWIKAAYSVAVLALSGEPGFLDSTYYLVTCAMFGVVSFRSASFGSLKAPPAPSLLRAVDPDEAYLTLPDGRSRHRIRAQDLLYLQAEDDYCRVHLVGGRSLLVTLNLGEALALAPSLIRVHRSYAVNRALVTVLHRAGPKTGRVELVGGCHVPIGRTFRPRLEAWMGQALS